MRYCKRCVMPDTRPNLPFDDEGVCGACRSFERRKDVDWGARRAELEVIFDRYRSKSGYYDCLVPVGGGKDSHYQVIKILEFGMTPLCVAASTDDLSPLGRRNLDNIRNLGVDLIEVSTNPVVRRKINRIALVQVGDVNWPEHVTIFAIPARIAVQKNIPLIVWGENGQNEYGGPASAAADKVRPYGWLQEFGSMQGMRPSDMIGQDGIHPQDMTLYELPDEADCERIGLTAIFLGYYIPWDSFRNVMFSQMYGFETSPTVVEGQATNIENLDNHLMGIHDYFMFLKYGYGRASPQVSMMIRRGIISREEALAPLKRLDGRFPSSYLGKPLEEILAPIGVSLDMFHTVCDNFTNKQLFRTNNKGDLIKDETGRPIKIIDNYESAPPT